MCFLVVAKGSDIKEECTKVTNRKCQCRGKFVPSESDSSICKCDIGFGLKNTGTEIEHCIQYIKEMVFLIIHYFSLTECLMCDDGYFSTQINSPCEKWREYVRCIIVHTHYINKFDLNNV